MSCHDHQINLLEREIDFLAGKLLEVPMDDTAQQERIKAEIQKLKTQLNRLNACE